MKDPDVPSDVEIPADLNRMIDVVLAYRPKPKTKAAKKRKRKQKVLEKIDTEKVEPS